jgi:hypothetical protein
MVLAVESPSLMTVQALECIQLYFIGIGQYTSGILCLGMLCLYQSRLLDTS